MAASAAVLATMVQLMVPIVMAVVGIVASAACAAVLRARVAAAFAHWMRVDGGLVLSLPSAASLVIAVSGVGLSICVMIVFPFLCLVSWFCFG